MSTRLPLALLLSLGSLAAVQSAAAQPDSLWAPPARSVAPELGVVGQPARFTDAQLDNLVAAVALYPDALLAQVLVAATFPDQVEDAARFVRANGTDGIDDQSWDVSVKSVAHYPSALNALADKLDWTTALGTAYANQSSDVMQAVQRLRRMADDQGNLVSNTQQRVVREQNNYIIVPAQPRVLYVPTYDPYVIYTRPVFRVGLVSRYWSFGIGFPIGGWLSYDCDWGTRVVYYNGWRDEYLGYGGGWRLRSRPLIQITNVYVNPRYRTVYVNRDVWRRSIDYRVIDRYPRVHRDTYFASRDSDRDRDRDWGRDRDDDRPRSAQPRVGTPRPGDGRPDGRDEGRASPEGYRRASSPAYDMSRMGSPAPAPRIERTPRGGEGTVMPRTDAPRSDAPRSDAPRSDAPRTAESPRRESPRWGLPREAPTASRGDARSQPRTEPRVDARPEMRRESGRSAPRAESPSRSAQPRSAQPRPGGEGGREGRRPG